MSGKGIPGPVRVFVMSMYNRTLARIEGSEERSKRMNMTRGVKQGDPLSTIFFQPLVDEAIARVKKSGVGAGDERVSVMAFAHDLVLVSQTPT